MGPDRPRGTRVMEMSMYVDMRGAFIRILCKPVEGVVILTRFMSLYCKWHGTGIKNRRGLDSVVNSYVTSGTVIMLARHSNDSTEKAGSFRCSQAKDASEAKQLSRWTRPIERENVSGGREQVNEMQMKAKSGADGTKRMVYIASLLSTISIRR